MRARTLQTWMARRIGVRRRLERVCTSYLLFLMVVTTKHSLEEAARFSGLHKSQFSKMLKAHSNVAVSTSTVFASLTCSKSLCMNSFCGLDTNM